MPNDKQRERLKELLENHCAVAECKAHSQDCTAEDCASCLADYLLANSVIVLPHALGEKVYCLAQPCGGCKCYNEPMTEEFIEICQRCDKWEIGVCDFDYELIPEWGKSVFPTEEQAKEALNKKLEEVRECK